MCRIDLDTTGGNQIGQIDKNRQLSFLFLLLLFLLRLTRRQALLSNARDATLNRSNLFWIIIERRHNRASMTPLDHPFCDGTPTRLPWRITTLIEPDNLLRR